MSEALRVAKINDYDLSFLDQGQGEPVLLVHGSLCDYRYWRFQVPALSERFRTIVPSLRHFYPAKWDGEGDGFSIAQHRDDLLALIEQLGVGPVHLVGHSRGGHIAFRVAQKRPDLVRRLVLSEPGGALEPDMSPHAAEVNKRFEPGSFQTRAAEKIRDGDVDGGLEIFNDAVTGPGTWQRFPEAAKQSTRDNAMTLLGQIRETREPFSRAAAAAVTAPTLLIMGGLSAPMYEHINAALAASIPNARRLTIDGASHLMNVTKAADYNAAVIGFLTDR